MERVNFWEAVHAAVQRGCYIRRLDWPNSRCFYENGEMTMEHQHGNKKPHKYFPTRSDVMALDWFLQ